MSMPPEIIRMNVKGFSGSLLQGVSLQIHPYNFRCRERCCIHNPSPHSLRSAELVWRSDFKRTDRLCKHDILHPDPDDLWFKSHYEGWEAADVAAELRLDHHCDGCCMGLEPASGDHFLLSPETSPEWVSRYAGYEVVSQARDIMRRWAHTPWNQSYVAYWTNMPRNWNWTIGEYPSPVCDIGKGWWEVFEDNAVVYHPPILP